MRFSRLDVLVEKIDEFYKEFKVRQQSGTFDFLTEYTQLNTKVSLFLYEQYTSGQFSYNLVGIKRLLEKPLQAIQTDKKSKKLTELDVIRELRYFLNATSDLYLDVDVGNLDKLPAVPGNAVIINKTSK